MAAEPRLRLHGSTLFVAAAAVFAWLAPLAPGFGDSAEVGAAAQTLGVAHPTGFPLDVMVLRLGAYLPLGTISFRQNLVVALISAAALALLAELSKRVATKLGAHPAHAAVGGVVAAVGLGTWATFLGTGLTVEVYSTAVLLVVLGGLELTRERPRVAVLGVLSGLAACAHVSAVVGLTPLVFAALTTDYGRNLRRRFGWLLFMTAMLLPIVLYLPLAAAANPALDWGDPQTLGRLWGHLSAERIRSAYQGAMLGADAVATRRLWAQLAELAWLVIPAFVGLRALARAWQNATLLLLAVFAADVAYASFINPMGVVDRQVGHLAGGALCLAAGMGVATLLDRVGRRLWARRVGLLLVAALPTLAVLAAPPTLAQDGSGEAELLGSGSSLAELPPRAVFVCRSDDVCAGALFARYAEWTRPDMAIVVEQHLWEPAERRRLADTFPSIAELGAERPSEARARASLAERTVAFLAGAHTPRPVFFEAPPTAAPAGLLAASGEPPFFVRADGPYVSFPHERALARFDREVAARLGARPPRHPLVRGAYSRAAGRLGKGLLALGEPRLAAQAFERATLLDPSRAAAFTNLGVARASGGDLPGALTATAAALSLDPTRSLAWLNLTRFRASRGDFDGARESLRQARDAGVWDPRFDQLAAAVESARRATGP